MDSKVLEKLEKVLEKLEKVIAKIDYDSAYIEIENEEGKYILKKHKQAPIGFSTDKTK